MKFSGAVRGGMGAFVGFAVVSLLVAIWALYAYQYARIYGWLFWAAMGLSAVGLAAVELFVMALGTGRFGGQHPGLATLAVIVLAAAVVIAIIIVMRRLQRTTRRERR